MVNVACVPLRMLVGGVGVGGQLGFGRQGGPRAQQVGLGAGVGGAELAPALWM